jgi:hypothetical protein
MSIRMRARDGTLGRTVFWNSDEIDEAGDFYTGPGPLTDVVVFKVDLNTGGGGEEDPGFAPFPEQWNYLGLEADLDTPMFALASTDFDDIRALRASSIVGLSARLTTAFDSGTVTVTVTINGTPGTLQLTFTAGQTEAVVTQDPGIDAYAAGAAIGVNVQTSNDFFIDGETDIEVWLDTSTAGAAVTAPVMLPEQWGRMALEASLDEPLETLVSVGFNDIMPIRANSVVGMIVRLSEAFDAGTVTVTVTVDGSPGTLQVVIDPGQTEVWLTQDSGIDSYAVGQPVGMQIQTSGDWSASNPVDLEAWLDVASTVTGQGGGSGGGGSQATRIFSFQDTQVDPLSMGNNDVTTVLTVGPLTPANGSVVQFHGAVGINLVQNTNPQNVDPQVFLMKDGSPIAQFGLSPGEIVGDGDYLFRMTVPIVWTEAGDGAEHTYTVEVQTDTSSDGIWTAEDRSLLVNVLTEVTISGGGGGGGGADPPRIWSYPKVNGEVFSGTPFLTVSGFQTTLGKRYTLFASGSWNGDAGNPGDIIDLNLVVAQDSGKGAITIVNESALVPTQLDNDMFCNLSGQGSIIGDGNVHDYNMYVTWNEPATWFSFTGGASQTWLTIIESDDQQA